MTTHFSILAWEIPWTEEPGGLQSIASQRVGHNWVTEHAWRSTWGLQITVQYNKKKKNLPSHCPWSCNFPSYRTIFGIQEFLDPFRVHANIMAQHRGPVIPLTNLAIRRWSFGPACHLGMEVGVDTEFNIMACDSVTPADVIKPEWTVWTPMIQWACFSMAEGDMSWLHGERTWGSLHVEPTLSLT